MMIDETGKKGVAAFQSCLSILFPGILSHPALSIDRAIFGRLEFFEIRCISAGNIRYNHLILQFRTESRQKIENSRL